MKASTAIFAAAVVLAAGCALVPSDQGEGQGQGAPRATTGQRPRADATGE